MRIGFRFEFALSKLCTIFEDASFFSIKRRCLKMDVFIFPDLIESIYRKKYTFDLSQMFG